MDDSVYFESYSALPLSHLKTMWMMRGLIESAVAQGIHKRSEADLRISALRSAMERVERLAAEARQRSIADIRDGKRRSKGRRRP